MLTGTTIAHLFGIKVSWWDLHEKSTFILITVGKSYWFKPSYIASPIYTHGLPIKRTWEIKSEPDWCLFVTCTMG